MSDEIRRLSEELARDPSSLAWLPLGDALRRRGELELALKVSVRAVERHGHNADAHDLLARVYADRGELDRAYESWDRALRLAPAHAGARKGLAYVLYCRGDLAGAERCLHGAAAEGADAQIAAALGRVRVGFIDSSVSSAAYHEAEASVTPGRGGASALRDGAGGAEDARRLFAEILSDGEHTALLLDRGGLVLAGAYTAEDGRDVAQEVGTELHGIREDAERALRDLALGRWRSVTFETEVATVAMAPVAVSELIVVAAARSSPLGLVRRIMERCVERAQTWLGVIA